MVDKYSAALEAARKTILEDEEKEWRQVKKSVGHASLARVGNVSNHFDMSFLLLQSGMTLSCRTIPDTTVKR